MEPEGKFRIEPLSHSKIRISVSEAPYFEFDAQGAAAVVGRILEAAKECHKLSGNALPNFTKNPSVWFALLPSALGLAPSRLADHESFVLQFGETILAVPIKRANLRQLGEAMVALSARSERGH